MLFIQIPEKTRRLSFYLAAEEYVASLSLADDCLFMWQTGPSVIFGRNQLIENEVNTDYCQREGIAMYRRKSGGGCVYSDMGNLMISFVTKERNKAFSFHRYLSSLSLALRDIGVQASLSGRNDIVVDGKKISGNAFYFSHNHSIVHGTLLYDTQMQHMLNAITPPHAKLESKGVESVRQRIGLLKDYTSLSLPELRDHLRTSLCDGCYTLTAADERAIEGIEAAYLTHDFIYGHNPRYTIVRASHIEGVGQLEARLELKNHVIRSANILGDFFIVGDLDRCILQTLKGVPLDRGALEQALPRQTEDIVLHLRQQDLIDLLLGCRPDQLTPPSKD
ncbi:MAG: lipoyltransferase [Bacteroidaceae bacterium]|nr:lipoyltransferase [Bacteroidaceae bacterium]